MHANPSTAHACAPTSPTSKADALVQKINEAPEWALPLIEAAIEAFVFHETSRIEAIIADPETGHEERELLTGISTKAKKALAKASFQPVFTKEQVMHFEESRQRDIAVRRRIALFSLCLTEKRMQLNAKKDPNTFLDMAESCSAFVDDCKAQLELAEMATARLLIVGNDVMGVKA